MLEGLLKGLVLWVYQLILEGVENFSNALIEVFNMDLGAGGIITVIDRVVGSGQALERLIQSVLAKGDQLRLRLHIPRAIDKLLNP